MAKFSKGHNKRKIKRKPDYNDRMITACKSMMIDRKLGYEFPESYYKEVYKLDK